jgi:hypothetical protein
MLKILTQSSIKAVSVSESGAATNLNKLQINNMAQLGKRPNMKLNKYETRKGKKEKEKEGILVKGSLNLSEKMRVSS